jgi:hypothetical protein
MLRARRRYRELLEQGPEGKYDELYRILERLAPKDSCAALCERASLFGVDVTDRETRRRIEAAYRRIVPADVIARRKTPALWLV